YFNRNGSLSIDNSTISGNTAASTGGAIYFWNGINDRGFAIRNSTISGNSSGSSGGAIYVSGSGSEPAGEVVIQKSTLYQNSAASFGGGIDIAASGPVTLRVESSIVAGNSAVGGQPDISAGTVTAKQSAIGDLTGIGSFNDVGGASLIGNVAGLNLQPLANNG